MEQKLAVTGEVIYESLHLSLNKKATKAVIHSAIERAAMEIPGSPDWASFLVIFSPGQSAEEIRCQIDVETNGSISGFAVGYGQRPGLAFSDAIERLNWYEKSEPLRISV